MSYHAAQHAVTQAATNSGTIQAIEGTPLSIGLAALILGGVIVGVSAIVGVVWTVATIRANDKAEYSKQLAEAVGGVQNGVTRLEKKVDTNHEQVHGRQNESIKVDGEMREKYGYVKGQQDLINTIVVSVVSNALKRD